jgi:hypothetical protein
MNDIQYLLQALIPFVQFAFVAAVVVFVLVAAVRIGWALAPWILGAAFLIYLFG